MARSRKGPRRAKTAADRLRVRQDLSISATELKDLVADWVQQHVPEPMRGLSVSELLLAANAGIGLRRGLARDLEDLAAADEALRRGPSGGYEELLNAFADAKRLGAAPDDVVRHWQARYGGFIDDAGGTHRLCLPLWPHGWALCDGARLWRTPCNPFNSPTPSQPFAPGQE